MSESEQAISEQTPAAKKAGGPSFSSSRSAESLRNLRNLVKQAAKELRRLKEENAVLAARIRELEVGPKTDPDTSLVSFDEDPRQLHTTVTGFIRTIDTYLAEHTE